MKYYLCDKNNYTWDDVPEQMTVSQLKSVLVFKPGGTEFFIHCDNPESVFTWREHGDKKINDGKGGKKPEVREAASSASSWFNGTEVEKTPAQVATIRGEWDKLDPE